MQKFILFYKGPATPPDASHEGWPEWFGKMGDKLVDKGSPLIGAFTMQSDEIKHNSTINFNGYSIIQAECLDEVQALVRSHPYLTLGKKYAIEVFELPE